MYHSYASIKSKLSAISFLNTSAKTSEICYYNVKLEKLCEVFYMNLSTELQEQKIFSQKDIEKFRKYINTKHSNLSEEKKQTILKNSIAYVLNKDLNELQIENVAYFIDFFVEETLLKDGEDLCANKILHTIITQATMTDTFLNNLTSWINKKIKIPLEKTFLENYIVIYNSSSEKYSIQSLRKNSLRNLLAWFLFCIVIITSLYTVFPLPTLSATKNHVVIKNESIIKDSLPAYVMQKYKKSNKNFPDYLYYKDVNKENLKLYLKSKNSMLKNEPYFSQLFATAKDFNLNPFLLFALAGHEQGFVPNNHPYGDKIINNPFNVFGSWQKYNTNFKDSSEIAARTLLNSLSDLPLFIDPFFWINRQYAEDPYWWRGIRSIFWDLENLDM